MKLKKGDNVIMLSGKDKGKKGKILSVSTADNRVTIEGLNLIKKHVRARQQGQKGQIIHKERSVSASSVAIICKSCGKPTRIGYKIEGINPDAKGSGLRLERRSKNRICKKCNAFL